MMDFGRFGRVVRLAYSRKLFGGIRLSFVASLGSLSYLTGDKEEDVLVGVEKMLLSAERDCMRELVGVVTYR